MQERQELEYSQGTERLADSLIKARAAYLDVLTDWEILKLARLNQLQSLLDDRNLVVCSGSHQSPKSDPESLGILPKEQLKLLYVVKTDWGTPEPGSHNRHEVSETLLQLCQTHFPRQVEPVYTPSGAQYPAEMPVDPLPHDSSQPYRTHVWNPVPNNVKGYILQCEPIKSNGKLYTLIGNEITTPVTTVYSEAVFEYFNLPPLPRAPRRSYFF